MRGHDDTGPWVGISHGILHQVADRDTELTGAAQHPGPRNTRNREGYPIPLGVQPPAIDRLGQYLVNLDDLRISQGIVGLQSGELDDLADEIGQPRGLDAHPACEPAYRGRVVGCILDSLGQQRDGANRSLQLVADVRDEVSTRFLDASGRGLIVGQHENQALVQRRNMSGEVGRGDTRASLNLQIGGAGFALLANGAHQLEQVRHDDSAAPDQTQSSRGRSGFEYLIVRANHDTGR